MQTTSRQLQKVLGILITIALLAALFQWRASQNLKTQKIHTVNFFVFWLAGNLILEGENPYNPDQWENGHALYGVTPREPTFLYPLPLAVLLTPLGLLSTSQAYVLWQWLSQLALGLVIYLLLKRWGLPSHDRLFVPVVFFLTFFGPIYLTLQIGTLGALTLSFIYGALYLLDKDRLLPAGILLSLTMLKPSQGATILLLLSWVFLLRKQWKVFYGLAAGGLLLLLLGIIVDPNWVAIFRQSSAAAFDRRLGVQPNVWSLAFVACGGISACYSLLGIATTLIFLGITAYFLWRKQSALSNWQVLNLVLPIAFITSPYLWAYDQILYVLPIIWIVGTLVEKSRSYISAIVFLILLGLISFYALIQQALTSKDLWSLGTSLFVIIFLFITQSMKQKPAIDKAPAPV